MVVETVERMADCVGKSSREELEVGRLEVVLVWAVEVAVMDCEVTGNVVEVSAALEALQIISRIPEPSKPASSRVLTFIFRQTSIKPFDALPSESKSKPASALCISESACSKFENICMPMALSHLKRALEKGPTISTANSLQQQLGIFTIISSSVQLINQIRVCARTRSIVRTNTVNHKYRRPGLRSVLHQFI